MITVGEYVSIGEYLQVNIRPRKAGAVTDSWEVYSKHGDPLGIVAWYPRWRQYCFQPITEAQTIWSAGCFEDLTRFIRAKMNERRVAREAP